MKRFGGFADGVTELNVCISSSTTRSDPERSQVSTDLIFDSTNISSFTGSCIMKECSHDFRAACLAVAFHQK